MPRTPGVQARQLMQACGGGKKIPWAARRGDVQSIERELSHGADVDARDYDDETPLMNAVMGRFADLDTLKVLVEAGADVNALSKKLQATPLLYAARKGRLEMVRYLIEQGADPSYSTPGGYTALTGTSCVPIMEELIRAGAPVEAQEYPGAGRLASLWSSGHFEAIQLYLRLGVDPSVLGTTRLMDAVALGDLDRVRDELRTRSDLDARDACKCTAWLLAVLTGNVEKARLLLEHGADPGVRGGRGWNGLHHAVALGHEEMTGWLLSEVPEASNVGNRPDSPMRWAVMGGHAGCVRLMLEAGVGTRVRSYSSHKTEPILPKAKNIETVNALVDYGEDIDVTDECGRWVLNTAAHDGKDDFVRQVLEAGAKVDKSDTGGSALHEAARWDRIRAARVLLEHGASMEIEDVDFDTPVSCAATQECLDLLVAAGGKIRSEDDIRFEH